MGNPYTVLKAKWTLSTKNSATKVPLPLLSFSGPLPLTISTFSPLSLPLPLLLLPFHYLFSPLLLITSPHHLFSLSLFFFTTSSYYLLSSPLLTTSYNYFSSPLLITITGRHVFMGYMYMPDKTSEAIDDDGTYVCVYVHVCMRVRMNGRAAYNH